MSFIGDSFGKLAKTGLGDLLFTRPGSNERIMPSQVVLSSKCFITFKVNGEKEQMAEFEQFTKAKRITEKKNFKPYGFTKNISLIKDEGWELSFSGKKTDPKLGAIISLQELLLNGETYSGFGDVLYANGVKLTFDIEELITYKPDDKGTPALTEIYVYKDSSILSYSEETPNDNQAVTFNISFFCPKREFTTRTDGTGLPFDLINSQFIGDNITNMIGDILQQNKQ